MRETMVARFGRPGEQGVGSPRRLRLATVWLYVICVRWFASRRGAGPARPSGPSSASC